MGKWSILSSILCAGGILLLGGCAQKEIKLLDLNDSKVKELHEIPQDASFYAKQIEEENELLPEQKHYKERFFRIWIHAPHESLHEVMWPYRVYNAKRAFYGTNLKRLDAAFYKEMEENSNFKDYLSVYKKALSVRTTDIRAFPTSRVLLKHPAIPGEGFPFDYLQNSIIAANKPLFVSHFSKDKEWAFVFSSFTSGWVKARNIVFIDENDAEVWMRAKQAHIFEDGRAVTDADGFLFRLRTGMMLPVIDEDDTYYTLLVATRQDLKTPIYKEIKISKEHASVTPLRFTSQNVLKVMRSLERSIYGWGGMYGDRDCSSTMRDYFAPFGIWLGRNSFVQSRQGVVYALDSMDEKQRIEFIRENARPFRTMLYRKGHIALYVGEYKNTPVIFQNVWGIKTRVGKKSGRVVIGRSVYSTLELGKDLPEYDENASFLHTLKSMNDPFMQPSE